jgi:predicted TIM-barrel fold metal-dependent hydrolase
MDIKRIILKAIDIHAHFSTEKGSAFRTPAEIEAAERIYKTAIKWKTDDQMANDFLDASVRAILDGPLCKDINDLVENNNYIGEMVAGHQNVFAGAWAHIPVHTGKEGLRELERCLRQLGMTGLVVNQIENHTGCNDARYYPFYELCDGLHAPVLINVGHSGTGAGLPGGGGLHLKHCSPLNVDDVAADFPNLTIIAGHPAWPWQDEMIAVLLHKPNVFNELHGWAPRYFSAELKKEIGGRLQDKIMFGSGYPLFSFERLFTEWESLGLSDDILEKVYLSNAQRILNIFK